MNLIQNYPWLKNLITEFDDGSFSIDELESDGYGGGWIKRFIPEMLEDIQKVIDDNNIENYEVFQIKEKYGQLRWYDSTSLTSDIIGCYSTISENTCAYCGKLNVPQTKNGWITPICKECYEKLNFTIPYEEAVNDDELGEFYCYTRFTNDGKTEKIKLPLRPYLDRIKDKDI